MTDIVERLSDLYYSIDDPDKCCLDAIDEIEKLRLENEKLQNCLNREYEGPELLKQLKHYANFQLDMYRPRHKVLLHNAANEIERLMQESIDAGNSITWKDECFRLRAELEQLKNKKGESCQTIQ